MVFISSLQALFYLQTCVWLVVQEEHSKGLHLKSIMADIRSHPKLRIYLLGLVTVKLTDSRLPQENQ
jgi:hypothetical protein